MASSRNPFAPFDSTSFPWRLPAKVSHALPTVASRWLRLFLPSKFLQSRGIKGGSGLGPPEPSLGLTRHVTRAFPIQPKGGGSANVLLITMPPICGTFASDSNANARRSAWQCAKKSENSECEVVHLWQSGKVTWQICAGTMVYEPQDY